MTNVSRRQELDANGFNKGVFCQLVLWFSFTTKIPLAGSGGIRNTSSK